MPQSKIVLDFSIALKQDVLAMKQSDLKTERDRRNWTQQELADRSGVDISTISRIEAGLNQNPMNATVTKLELALRLKRGTLVFGQPIERAS